MTEPARDGLLTGLTASSAGDDGADRDGALRDKATEVSFTVRMVSGMIGGVAESLVKTTAQVTSYEHTVDSVRSVSAQLAAQMVTLSEKSRQVERVLAFIEDLALQTRMLSLNAAIEAARAGERGQGFAVVASAVRDLSRQTNAATTDIRDALTEIQRAALTATGRTTELDSALEGIRSTTHEFVATLTEQSQVSSTASRYVDEAAISVEAIATQLAAPSSHPQSKEEGAPHVTDGLE